MTAFDLKREQVPRDDVWPPNVARVLNDRAGEDYPVRNQHAEERIRPARRQELEWDR